MTRLKRGEEPQVGEDGDTTYVYSRAEDRSIWVYISWLMEKYKILFWLAGLFFLAAGFGFRTPAQANAETQKTIEEIRLRAANTERLLESTQQTLGALVRLRCFEAQTESKKDLIAAAGLNCNPGAKP